jgi:hypothetical protein
MKARPISSSFTLTVVVTVTGITMMPVMRDEELRMF